MHERDDQTAIPRGLRGFYRWIAAPIVELRSEIRELRSEIRSLRSEVKQMERTMALQFDRLATEVGEMESVVDSAVTVMKALAAEIRNVAGNETASKALADRLDAKAATLGAAIEESTPADPDAPPVEPPVEPPVDPNAPPA